jgi:hypothetical protein
VTWRGAVGIFSLLLALATAWLWVTDTSGGHLLAMFASDGRMGGILSWRGRVSLVMTNVGGGTDRAWTAEARRISDDDARILSMLVAARTEHDGRTAWFAWAGESFPGAPESRFVVATVPHGLLLVVLAVPAVLGLRGGWIVWRRRREGCCPQCSYDLRATPARCPECGWEREAPPAELDAPA